MRLGRTDLATDDAPDVGGLLSGPIGAAPHPGLGRPHLVERDDRGTDVLGVHMAGTDGWPLGLPYPAHVELAQVSIEAREVRDLKQSHVSASVSAATCQRAPGGGVVLHRSDDFEERIAQCHNRVFQAEFSDARVLVVSGQAEQLKQLAAGGLQVRCREGDLA